MSLSSLPTALAIAALASGVISAVALRVSAYPSMPPPATISAAPSAMAALATLASELVGRRAGGRIGRDADGERVLAGLDRDVLRDRRGALHAPRAELVLAGEHARELPVALVVRDGVGRRRHHRDVRAHVRVEVAAEPDDAFLLELELAR